MMVPIIMIKQRHPDGASPAHRIISEPLITAMNAHFSKANGEVGQKIYKHIKKTRERLTTWRSTLPWRRALKLGYPSDTYWISLRQPRAKLGDSEM